MKFTSIAIFCGSQNGANPLFAEQARHLGSYMGKNNITLIYGGGNKGLMGAVANAAMENGGKVRGIIPEVLVGWEHQHSGITDLQVVLTCMRAKKLCTNFAMPLLFYLVVMVLWMKCLRCSRGIPLKYTIKK
jgi:uncharacterized protein (TIGR00730 family)